ncbi:hypothetical protein [Pseudomonas syringae]|nr:hypothetical protein [Pseudomonas syringae]
MNITSKPIPTHVLPRPSGPGAEKALSSTPKINEDPREARAKAFYTREAEPWKGKTYTYHETGKPEEKRPLTKEMYLDDLKSFSTIELQIQQCFYAEIRNELGVFRPDLASKNFSYTLGDDEQIKILNQDLLLTEEDVQYLTKIFNDRSEFKWSVHRHAKMAMALVDHEDTAFGSQYTLNLLNTQNTLDYGKLVLLKPERMHEAFVRQIIENGESREQPWVDTNV